MPVSDEGEGDDRESGGGIFVPVLRKLRKKVYLPTILSKNAAMFVLLMLVWFQPRRWNFQEVNI